MEFLVSLCQQCVYGCHGGQGEYRQFWRLSQNETPISWPDSGFLKAKLCCRVVRKLYCGYIAQLPASSSLRESVVVPNYPACIGPYQCGRDQPLLWIAGPCVLETREMAFEIAEELQRVAAALSIQLVFKASFDKANRTSSGAYRGPGLREGLEILAEISRATGLPVTTDIHESTQAAAAGEVCELLQIPAFLARQTDLLIAAARTGRAVNVKKGQFMAPWDMQFVVNKLGDAGCQNILLCERGTFFGYGRLVNDMRSIPQMQSLGVPVVFDATHSVQEPGGLGGATGGNRAMVEPLALAAMALGAEGLFSETHPDPDRSPSDGANMIPLGQIEAVMRRLVAIRQAATNLN